MTCLDCTMLFFLKWETKPWRIQCKWAETPHERQTDAEWNKDRQRRQAIVIIRSACATKELSHCYVNPNEIFMSKPSSHYRPIGTAHEWPIWPLGHYLKLICGNRGHFARLSVVDSYQTQRKWQLRGRARRGTSFIGNESDGSYVAAVTKSKFKPLKQKEKKKGRVVRGCWGARWWEGD